MRLVTNWEDKVVVVQWQSSVTVSIEVSRGHARTLYEAIKLR